MVAPLASYARMVTLVARSVATVREQEVSRSGLKAEKQGGEGIGTVGCVMTVFSVASADTAAAVARKSTASVMTVIFANSSA